MRIVAGRYRGRRIEAPAGSGTRPTTDRVREALFSSLTSVAGPGLGGGAVLDAFAGSGALGLEALSRGAGPVTFVERDRKAAEVIRRNIASLECERECNVVVSDVFALAKRGVLRGPFALILLDAPYTLDAAEIGSVLQSLSERGALADDAVVTWEHAAAAPASWPEGFEVVAEKRYGATAVDIAVWERGVGGS